MNGLLAGALAGFAATVPMTAAMKLMHESIPEERQLPLPPEVITMNAAEALGVGEALDDRGKKIVATGVGHFAYGAVAGALYWPLTSHLDVPPAVKGVGFGLAVWAGSYLGWLPATGLLSPATKHPARRNALMIAAHIIWGAALGAAADKLVRGD